MTFEQEVGKSDHAGWPKITLITPVFNSVRYLEQAIQSVISQQYPNLEYFIVDGGSTDGSLEIIRKYERCLSGWSSQPDNGMYDALNRGFAQSSGEVMGWISATDLLHTRSLFLVGGLFQAFPQVEWITGRPTGFNEDGMPVDIDRLKRWARVRFLAGANRHIQQESTFWRRSLWERAGGRVDDSRRNCSDFELWVRFFRHAKLYSVDALIGGFRFHGDSLGLIHADECNRIQEEAIEAELKKLPWGWAIRAFRGTSSMLLRIPVLSVLWKNTVLSAMLRMPGPDWAPVIEYKKKQWRFR